VIFSFPNFIIFPMFSRARNLVMPDFVNNLIHYLRACASIALEVLQVGYFVQASYNKSSSILY